jgi:tRNA (guanine-N7-)-methyltransferase
MMRGGGRSGAEEDHGVPIPGRILPADQWARTAIKRLPPPGPLDWKCVFGRPAPVVLDIGCGNGRFLITSALQRPHLNHLGIDILPVVIRYATRRANQRGLHHARLAVIGGYEFLAQYVAPASLAEIHLYHPQPYRDAEKAHRRLLTPEFLALAWQALAAEGLLVVQTDHPAYWRYLTQVLPRWFDFQEHHGRWPDAPAGRTRREIYARRHGLTIWRGTGRPRADLTVEQAWQQTRQAPRPDFRA